MSKFLNLGNRALTITKRTGQISLVPCVGRIRRKENGARGAHMCCVNEFEFPYMPRRLSTLSMVFAGNVTACAVV